MFNRRFIREKVIQASYGFFQGGAESAMACRQNLLAGLEQTAQLYYFHLKFIVDLAALAKDRYTQAKERGREAESLEGLRRMAENTVVEHLAQDVNFLLKSESYRPEKRAYGDLLSTVYDSLFSLNKESSPAMKAAKKAEDVSEDPFERDREFLRKLYKRKIAEHAALRSFCEERSIYWESDYESVTFWVYSLLGKMSAERNNNVDEGLNAENEDVKFGLTLLDKTLMHAEEYNEYIAPRLQNWNHERIGAIERLLLCVAMSELVNFPSIPVKASLNEYVELSKQFCSKESTPFVNGVLHRLTIDLKADKKMQKSGRGLI
ncbi:MAG: transcription antitermination protein NusB [Bacteroides sp.]|nr:transcription antitermination protein NusB [Ruminococcus flavefaciens]MCM1555420.1 transcription antitermination protein NusB [Bacteroides sp.]